VLVSTIPVIRLQYKLHIVSNTLIYFIAAIYHNILRRELGSEVHKVAEMKSECDKIKKRISQINDILSAQRQGGDVAPEELDDFEINTECVAFARR
jgi:hypothetical protein